MLIKSFLAIPRPGELELLEKFIQQFPNCEVTSPDNREKVLVVVMENASQKAEDEFLLKLHESSSLEHMVLVSSFNAAV